MKIIVVIIFLVAAIAAAAQTTAQTPSEAEKASVEMVRLFQQQKFAEALPFAEKAVEIYAREFGADHLKTAKANINLGYVQRGRDKQKEAVAAFEKALPALDKNPNLNKSDALLFAAMLESLGYLKFNQGKQGGSEKYYQRALELREKFNGADSKETASVIWSLANLNRSTKDYARAAELYRRAYELRAKNLGMFHPETAEALERGTCTLLKMNKQADADALKQKDDAARRAAEAAFNRKSEIIIESGVINGKALNLAKPPYPAEAKQARADGTVNVKVTIDETGKVIHACSQLNQKTHPALIEVSEWAAYQSTFTPTLADGKPVKATGIIVYNFVAR